jgi:hypothetical protein
MDIGPSFDALADRDLLDTVRQLAASERSATVALIAALGEVDSRRAYLGEGCSSLFTYCTRILHLSEHAAYARIEAARTARRFPAVLHLLTTGELTLTTVCLLGRHLTDDNHSDLLKAARYKSKREVEHLVAVLRPRPDVTPMMRKLPTAPHEPALANSSRATSGSMNPGLERPANSASHALPLSAPEVHAPAAQRTVVAPLAATRYKVQFTIGQATHDKLRHAQDLLRHVIPNGDPAEIFDRALTLLVQHLEKAKVAAARRPGRSRSPSPRSRRIPADVRRAVWKRDGGQCAFVGRSGRCSERGFLEFHHVMPYARGGMATEENIELRCRAHNQYEAEQEFGRTLVVREHLVPYFLSSVRTELSADPIARGFLAWEFPSRETPRNRLTPSLFPDGESSARPCHNRMEPHKTVCLHRCPRPPFDTIAPP